MVAVGSRGSCPQSLHPQSSVRAPTGAAGAVAGLAGSAARFGAGETGGEGRAPSLAVVLLCSDASGRTHACYKHRMSRMSDEKEGRRTL